MNKILTVLLLSFSQLVFSTEIYNIKEQTTGLIIYGIGLKKINKIKLGGKFLRIDLKSNNYITTYCKKPNQYPCSENFYLNEGTYLLQIYKNKTKPFKEMYITIPKRIPIVFPEPITPIVIGRPLIPPIPEEGIKNPIIPSEPDNKPSLPILP